MVKLTEYLIPDSKPGTWVLTSDEEKLTEATNIATSIQKILEEDNFVIKLGTVLNFIEEKRLNSE